MYTLIGWFNQYIVFRLRVGNYLMQKVNATVLITNVLMYYGNWLFIYILITKWKALKFGTLVVSDVSLFVIATLLHENLLINT